MKTARRHELKENDLAHYLETVVDWTSANAKLIVLGIVGLCAVIAAWFYFQQRNKQSAGAAWDQVDAAIASDDSQKLQQFVVANKNTAAGQLANLRLADIAFDEGIGQMSVDRDAAEKRLNDAKNRYYDVEQVADDSRIEQLAVQGLARYFETIGDLDKAKEHYGRLAKIENGLFRHKAERKLADLARPSSEQFAKWYTGLRPKPQPSGSNPLIQSKLGEIPGFPGSAAEASPAGTSAPGTSAPGTGPAGTAAATPSASPTGSASPSPSGSPTASPSGSPTASPSATPSPSATGTAK